MVVVEHDLPVQLGGAGLGTDFNAAEAHAVELRGKRVLVDANFADGRLGRQLSAGEAVNVNLSAVRSRGRARERLQFRLQFVRIVRERVQVFAADNHAAGIAVGIYADLGGIALNVNLLLLHRNFKL